MPTVPAKRQIPKLDSSNQLHPAWEFSLFAAGICTCAFLQPVVLISAVVLAAGPSLRLGKPKQLVRIGGTPLLGRILGMVKSAGVDEVIVVLGLEASRIMRVVPMRDTRVVIIKPGGRMSSSLREGIRAVNKRSEAALIVLADMPFVSSAMMKKIIHSYRRTRSRIVALGCAGTQTPPAIFDRSLFDELMLLKGDRGAKTIIKRHSDEVKILKVKDSRLLMDVDTSSDLRRAKRYQLDYTGKVLPT